MRRLLCPVCTAVLLSATPATSAAPDAGLAPAPPTAAAAPSDAGTPTPADPPIAPERLSEARALVPPLLLYGQLQPVVGTWVEYTVRSKQVTFPVRAAIVGETPRERDTLYQVELDYQTSPRALIIAWVARAGTGRAMVERLAITVPPNTPVAIPVDLVADHAGLRGALVRQRDTDVREGPFAGKGHEQTFRLESGQRMTVVTAARVPVFGVESLRDADVTWTARKSGTGAKPTLDSVPLMLPRMPVP
ncbi:MULTISPECIES: hypothetical protein [unclassified Corallococcus]|uniref:hypothetical protein n=1 Tax=unclassified Corallococcus TaxID=2685029 RepID=UPI001A9057A7|nr:MULTISPECIES: hypothetical protein [unclassified Corallococcus]MBN9686466.1 hypothetical protein [Corallococcus sp. NCSPR001]WAS82106.1 hypothetical protein O0N60_22575 [Corallococcus sp. NCRR]